MDDLLVEFLTETNEAIAELDVEIVKLEQNPNDPKLIGSIFRLVHAIKGTCGFLGLPRLEQLAHAAENVLGKFRDRELEVTPQAAYLTLAVAEYFRDQGLDVLCMMDSVTRFAMAQREIGLSVGEPPTTKGYPPSVFGELPRLLERAGPGAAKGSITGLFTVLVEGDDHNEPIADAVRGILDGHIVLDRAIAERGRYPAINVLRSISRTMPGCNSPPENELVLRARGLLAAYEDMAEMIRLGAYRAGSDPRTDEAIRYQPALEAFLGQLPDEHSSLDDAYAGLGRILE
ncbi:MAG: hypothetical protein EXQ87_03820 [Alphaproteobacteria bacterium]|nr:hypothetical protein [Alphaproteobacteria bacterium]